MGNIHGFTQHVIPYWLVKNGIPINKSSTDVLEHSWGEQTKIDICEYEE
jgi:hypothetical protein